MKINKVLLVSIVLGSLAQPVTGEEANPFKPPKNQMTVEDVQKAIDALRPSLEAEMASFISAELQRVEQRLKNTKTGNVQLTPRNTHQNSNRLDQLLNQGGQFLLCADGKPVFGDVNGRMKTFPKNIVEEAQDAPQFMDCYR